MIGGKPGKGGGGILTVHMIAPPILLNPNPTSLIRTSLSLLAQPALTLLLPPLHFLLRSHSACSARVPYVVAGCAGFASAGAFGADHEGC